jgi:hypothetical protein
MNRAARPKRLLRLAALLLLLPLTTARAQESFRTQHASARYDALVRVAGCGGADQDREESVCSGPGAVSLYRKGAAEPFQTLRLPNVLFDKRSVADEPGAADPPYGLYSAEYGLVFRDFNFDGREDLAVCNGRDSAYGGPSYTVFLFKRGSGRFVESRSLSELAEGAYLGLFTPDPKRRVLTVFSKSGCCYHRTDTYRVVNDRAVLVEQLIEDATPWGGAGDNFVLITTRKKVGRRWVVRTKRVKTGGVGRPRAGNS